MSLVTLPSQFTPSSCVFSQMVSQRVNASPFGGSEQAVDLLNDRWKVSIQLPMKDYNSAAYLEAFIGAMRGQTNTVALYHFAKPVPRGTARGTQTLSASVAQGASSLPITGISPANGTYLAGDMIGVAPQLFMVAADTNAVAGAANVPITGRVRSALSSGASVVWNAPTALFRLLATSDITYIAAFSQAASFDFGEAI